ncbi:MAG: hypothetical protein N2606_01795 [Candidatus Omnitrophica bacterium]|nr:hypothetical protein [Candidatus Omnitrophota bacterium]
MQDKTKFIIIGLGAVLVVLLFLLVNCFQYISKLKQDNEVLVEEKSSLSSQLATITKERKELEEKLKKAKEDLQKIEQDRTALETNIKNLSTERDQLKNELEELNKRLAKISQQKEEKAENSQQKEYEIGVSSAADAYWAGVLKRKAELEVKLETALNDLRALKLANEQLKKEKEQLAMDLKSLETDTKDSAREYVYAKKLADTLTQQLAQEKTDKFQLLETLKSLKSENKYLKQQLKVIYDRKAKLEEKYAQLQDKNAQLESNMAKMEAFVREKVIQAEALRSELGLATSGVNQPLPAAIPTNSSGEVKKDTIELAPIVVRPLDNSRSSSSRTVTPISAQVIAVNRENNFVIINKGLNTGVKIGDQYRVFKNDQSVGLLEVIQVRENIAACDIKSEDSPIAVGDSVR